MVVNLVNSTVGRAMPEFDTFRVEMFGAPRDFHTLFRGSPWISQTTKAGADDWQGLSGTATPGRR